MSCFFVLVCLGVLFESGRDFLSLAASLISWGEGFVAPTQVGQVYLFSSEDGEQLGSPFPATVRSKREDSLAHTCRCW